MGQLLKAEQKWQAYLAIFAQRHFRKTKMIVCFC